MRGVLLAGCIAMGLSACVDVEDYFLTDGRLQTPGQYTFSYPDEPYGLLDNESMYFTEDERTLIELETIDDQGNPAVTYSLYLGDPANIATDTVIVYCHGNGTTLETALRRATYLGNIGGKSNYGVLVPEYLGFGLSDGEISEENLYIGVTAGIQWLAEQGLTEDRIVIYGVSLGSAASVGYTEAPRVLTPQKIMLEAPLASIATLSQDVLGVVLDISFFSANNALDNIGKMPNIDQPLLVMHGTADGYIDYESNGLPLYNAYQGTDGTLVPVEDASHGNVPETMGFAAYEETLLDFIRR